jgi:tetratricopeptide (TPR) repeat protein
MKPRFTCLLLALLGAPLLAAPAQEPTPVTQSSQTNSPTDAQFITLIREAQSLHSSQRHFDALQKIAEAELLLPTNPLIFNVRGSIYTAMRDYEKARSNFLQAQAHSPTSFEPRFNLVELDFVQGKFAEAATGFSQLLTDFPKLRLDVRHLTQFKVLVCQLKQDKVAEAREIMKNFSFMDDTPAYYYSKAAFEFQEGDTKDGRDWLGRAAGIYQQQMNIPYLDTLMEARWVDSLSVPNEAGKDLPATTPTPAIAPESGISTPLE